MCGNLKNFEFQLNRFPLPLEDIMNIARLSLAVLLCLLFAAPVLATEHTIGLGVGSAPDYEGSEDNQAIPLLMLKGKYDSGRSFSLQGTNLKINAVPSKTYNFGPVLNYRMKRDDVDNDQVDAMKDVDAATELGLYGSVDINSWILGFEFLGDVSGEHEGLLTQVSAGSIAGRLHRT